MKILILGGTQMIGRDFVEFLLKQQNIDHDIYIANRGITNPQLFNNVHSIKIDRNSHILCKELNSMYFDIVIDFSCYNKDQLKNILSYIRYDKYTILSTLCVSDQVVLSDKDHWLYDYCKNKKNLEEYILLNNIKNIVIVRPCVLYGKYDYTGRFYEKNDNIYWTHDNKLVEENKYHIHVSKFTKYLYKLIIEENHINKIIHINGEGVEISDR